MFKIINEFLGNCNHRKCFKSILILRPVHMTRFAYVCKFCVLSNFAYVCKSGHVYAFTHVCKICTYAKVGKFAHASDQVQISFCVYMQILHIFKFGHVYGKQNLHT